MPSVTKNLVVINVLLWLASVMMGRWDMSNLFGLHYPASPAFRWYQLVTYMFMHAGLAHVFFNMFAVYMFGSVLENLWGPKRYLTYYFVTGVGAGIVNIAVVWLRLRSVEAQLSPEMIEMVYTHGAEVLSGGKNYSDPLLGTLNLLYNSRTAGASGAVFGVLLAFGMLFPNVEMYIIPFPFPIKAKYMVAGYGVIELFAGVANFSFDNVAHFAHLGGMLFGFVLLLVWKRNKRNNKNNYNDGYTVY